MKQRKRGEIKEGSTVVAVLTGNGLKDPTIAMDVADIKPLVLPNDERVVFEHIQGAVHQ
jgi:threonine synthase